MTEEKLIAANNMYSTIKRLQSEIEEVTHMKQPVETLIPESVFEMYRTAALRELRARLSMLEDDFLVL